MTIAAKPLLSAVHDALKFTQPIAGALQQSDEQIIITGATGWLGQALLEMLVNSVSRNRILAFSSQATEIFLRDGSSIHTQPLSYLSRLPKDATYALFHFAFLTKDKTGDMSLEDYIARNTAIHDFIDTFLGTHTVSGMCVTSSGAVYNKDRTLNRDRNANAYAALKVEDEEFFLKRCEALKIPLTIPRIFNMSGPHINKWDAYALSSLIHMALKKEPLVIKAKQPVIRAYAYVGDILNATLERCLSGETSIFDACTPDAIEIGELAMRVCHVLACTPPIQRDYHPELPEDRYLGDSVMFLASCKKANVKLLNMNEQIRITAEDLQRRL